MHGRSGMIHQLETIGTDFTRLLTLIKWLCLRCIGTRFQSNFDEAFKYLLQNNNQGLYLIGILVRPNIIFNEQDLRSRGEYLGSDYLIQQLEKDYTFSILFASFIRRLR